MHAWFVSYRHPARAGSLQEKLINHTVNAIKDHIEVYTQNYDVYFDKDRLIPGYQYDDRLASAICQSACMAVLYFPSYLESPYCLKEIDTMLALEKRRNDLLGDKLRGSRLFIPVILRGEYSELPELVTKNCQYLDYTKQSTNPSFNIGDDLDMGDKLFKIAEYIANLCKIMRSIEEQLFSHCDTFGFSDVTPGIQPSPVSPQPFPGQSQ